MSNSSETARRTAAGLHGAGVIDDAEMAEIDALADRVGEKLRQTLGEQQITGTIDEIRAYYRELRYLMKSRIAMSNRLGAYVRTRLGWSKQLQEEDEAAAAKIVKAAAKAIEDRDPRFAAEIDATNAAAQAFGVAEARAELTLRKLARSLPVWARFGAGIKGFGELGLAVIVGEAGNLSDYDGFAKLWKRLGLGLVDGKQQGKPGAGATAMDWIAHGYSPQRRSTIFAYIGEPLLKQGPYRDVYLARKELELSRGKSKGHSHMAAHRYMEKALIKHLWKAWRREDLEEPVEMTKSCVSTAAAPLEAAVS